MQIPTHRDTQVPTTYSLNAKKKSICIFRQLCRNLKPSSKVSFGHQILNSKIQQTFHLMQLFVFQIQFKWGQTEIGKCFLHGEIKQPKRIFLDKNCCQRVKIFFKKSAIMQRADWAGEIFFGNCLLYSKSSNLSEYL